MHYHNYEIKLALVTLFFAMPVYAQASDFCDLTEQFSEMVLQKRLHENQSKYTSKAMLRYANSQLANEKHSEFLSKYLNDMVDSAYEVNFGNSSAENRQIIARFARDNKNNCLAEMRAKEKRLAELKARKRELERKQVNLSGQYYGINTSTSALAITHTVQCKTGRLGTVIQNKDGNIHAYFNKNNPSVSVRNHDYNMTLSQAARLACK